MSAEALLFLWREPYYTSRTSRDASRYAHWYYLGSFLGLADYGNQYYNSGKGVDVYLVAGQITGWVDYSPSDVLRRRRLP